VESDGSYHAKHELSLIRILLSPLLWIALLAIALRIGLGALRTEWLTEDADGYLAHARMVVTGYGFAGPATGRPTAFRPPAYPVTLALFWRQGLSPAAAVLLVNTGAILLLLALLSTCGRSANWNPRTVWVAQLAVAVDPLLLRYSLAPMTEVVCAAVLMAALAALHNAQRAAESQAALHHVMMRWLLAGAMFGLGALVRPTVYRGFRRAAAGWNTRQTPKHTGRHRSDPVASAGSLSGTAALDHPQRTLLRKVHSGDNSWWLYAGTGKQPGFLPRRHSGTGFISLGGSGSGCMAETDDRRASARRSPTGR
jgi:hypothetical protein